MKNFFLASRPKTLLAAFIPPLMSYALANVNHFEVDVILVISCILSALLIQLATNFFNDLIDFQKGADNFRHGPIRVTSSGLVGQNQIRSWAISSLVAACIFAIPLIMKGGMIILIPGVISLYLTYGYTGGPLPLAYKGLGEIFVFLFFGIFSVMGSFFIFTGSFHQDSVVLAIIYGLLTTTLICINNLRDRDEDKKVHKFTLATRISEKSYQFLTLLTIYIPYIMIFSLKSATSLWLLAGAFPISIKLSQIVLKEKKEGLNAGLKFAAIHLLIFSIFLIISMYYENIFS